MKIKSFNIKTKKVQDYPDTVKTITMYGKSKKSKFKLGDSVVLINYDVRYYKQNIIGFDIYGKSYIDKCAWSCTRFGYDDEFLILFDDFNKIFKNLNKKQLKYIDEQFEKIKNNLYLYNSKLSMKKTILVKEWDYIISLN